MKWEGRWNCKQVVRGCDETLFPLQSPYIESTWLRLDLQVDDYTATSLRGHCSAPSSWLRPPFEKWAKSPVVDQDGVFWLLIFVRKWRVYFLLGRKSVGRSYRERLDTQLRCWKNLNHCFEMSWAFLVTVMVQRAFMISLMTPNSILCSRLYFQQRGAVALFPSKASHYLESDSIYSQYISRRNSYFPDGVGKLVQILCKLLRFLVRSKMPASFMLRLEHDIVFLLRPWTRYHFQFPADRAHVDWDTCMNFDPSSP